MTAMGIGKNCRGVLFSGLLALTLCACQESEQSAEAAADTNEFTPVVASVLAAPVPVRGSDGRYHFVYELMISNSNNFEWELQSVEVFAGGESETLLHRIAAESVAANTQLLGTRAQVDSLKPAQSALVFIQFAVDSEEAIPERLVHRLAVTVPGGLPEKITDLLQLPAGQAHLVETVAPVAVDRRMVVALAPPLEGAGWIAANGCCDSITHVRSDLPVNGQLHISQRFAIDWLKVNEERRLYVGDPQDLNSWFGYGNKVLAVADGLVVTVVDKFSNQKPFVLPAETGAITLEEIDGNHVIIALGNGQYAFYAHLQPGSIRVKQGETVKTGQLLGLLGNTGNTGAPHLHFHIMQGGSSLGSNGLPYVFRAFTLMGKTSEHAFFDVGLEDNTP
ncbi:M23 family metallopeptidase [Microbulbifer taiwanensis]